MAAGIGAIGVGGIGHLELHFLTELEGVDIVAAADVSPGAREVFEAEFDAPTYEDYRELLDAHAEQMDGVLIATPHAYHYEQATACLEAGVNVLLEKPMVVDVRDAVALAETARQRDLVLQVGYQRQFHPAFQAMKSIIESGRIGDVHTVTCYIGQDWIAPHQGTWRVDPELSGGGQLYDTGSHLVDALVWLLDGVPRTVTASIEYATPGIDVSAALTVRFEREAGPVTASVTVTGDGVAMDPREGYVIWGTHGSLVYADHGLYVEHKGATRYQIGDGLRSNFDEMTRGKMRHFVDVISGGAELMVTPDEGVQVTALTEAAYRAADEGKTVDVQELLADTKRDEGEPD